MWNELLRASSTGRDPVSGQTTRQIVDSGTDKGKRMWEDITGVKSVDRKV